jgi:hypothetical protein
MLIASYLTPTATTVRCRQCWSVTNIRLIEPDLRIPLKERHTFVCDECGLPCTYEIDREDPAPRH